MHARNPESGQRFGGPSPQPPAQRRVPQHPPIVVIPERDGMQLPPPADAGRRQVGPRVVDGALVANELRAAAQPPKPLECRLAPAAGIRPVADTVVVAVTDERPPKPRRLVIAQPNVVACDRAAGKSAEYQAPPVTAILTADERDRRPAVRRRRVRVAPPGDLVPASNRILVRRAHRDEALPARDSVSQIRSFGHAARHVPRRVRVVPVPGVFDDHRVFAATPPIVGMYRAW